jgi:hypothetical protein
MTENETKENGNADAVSSLTEMVNRLEKANEKAQELLKKQEELTALNLLGGKSDAGQPAPVIKEESPSEYRKRVEAEVRSGKYEATND